MPIREYLCLKCGHEFEEIVYTDQGMVPCPHCESVKTERLISAHGGYQGDFGGGSTRPKSAGSFQGRKKV